MPQIEMEEEPQPHSENEPPEQPEPEPFIFERVDPIAFPAEVEDADEPADEEAEVDRSKEDKWRQEAQSLEHFFASCQKGSRVETILQ